MASVEVQLVEDQHQTYVRTLLNEYLEELSTHGDVDHSYPYFEAYWKKGNSRWPYFILWDGSIVGFAFVNAISPSGRRTDFSMAEFYIQPIARGRGCGLAAAKELFRRHAGQWELSIMSENEPAQNFWPKTISAVNGLQPETFEHDGETIHRFSIKLEN